MRFPTLFVTLLGACRVMAQTFSPNGPNPIINPGDGASIPAGKDTTITWTPTTGGTVTLTLRYGPSQNLAKGTVIASSVQNSGSYTWSVPQDIGSGSYTIEIKGTDNVANYSPIFSVTGGTGTQGSSASSKPTSSSSKPSSSSSTSDSSSSSSTTSSKSSSSSGSSSSSSTSRASSSATSAAATKAPSNAAVPVRAGGGLAALGLGAFALLV